MDSGQPHFHFGTLGQLQHGEAYADAYLNHRGVVAPEPSAAAELDGAEPMRLVLLLGGRGAEGEGAFSAALSESMPELATVCSDVPFWFSLGGGLHCSTRWAALGPSEKSIFINFLGACRR